MKSRFEGKTNRDRLVATLEEQVLIRGNARAAETLAELGTVEQFESNANLIVEGDVDNAVYFLLTGSVAILVKGRTIAERNAGEAVGEMSAIDPTNPRSASVIARKVVVALKLTSEDFIRVANEYPEIFRRVLATLSRRLVERNKLVKPLKENIDVLMISSVEGLPVARGVQNAFKHDPFDVSVWTDGVFKPASYPLSDLEARMKGEDFVFVIISADDWTESRGHRVKSARDNVTFELGLAIGELGSRRVIQLEPLVGDVKTPSDLIGVNTIGYEFPPSRDLPTSLGPACNEVRDYVLSLGPRED